LPTSTFYRLSVEKRERLVQAIRQEFIREPVDKVSVNRIIAEAGISRGSYYQYFRDKNDLVGFVLLDYREKMRQTFEQSVVLHKGEPFAVVDDILAWTIHFGTQPENFAILRNIFIHLKVCDKLPFSTEDGELCGEDMHKYIERLDLSMLDFQNDEERDDIAEIAVSMFRHALSEVFFHPEQAEKIQAAFRRKMQLLKRGIVRKEQ